MLHLVLLTFFIPRILLSNVTKLSSSMLSRLNDIFGARKAQSEEHVPTGNATAGLQEDCLTCRVTGKT